MLADSLADIWFAPTERARGELLREGRDAARIHVTGNTVIDALQLASQMPFEWSNSPLAQVPGDKRLVLLTVHRRENFGAPFASICAAIQQLADKFADAGYHFVYPVHPNPNVCEPARQILGLTPNVTLLEPLDYLSLVHLMKRCTLILTDSGGIQEEAPGLGVPVLVLRETTERPEGVEAGVTRLVGSDRHRIVQEVDQLLTDSEHYRQMTKAVNPYGDGRAAERILSILAANS